MSKRISDPIPKPVSGYLRSVLKDGHSGIRAATLNQEGEFRLSTTSSWKQFEASQSFSLDQPGFVWQADIHLAPLITVKVRDAYQGGVGSMKATALNYITLVNQTGVPEVNNGSLQRYLAESAWIPTLLLPGGSVTWDGIDDQRANATFIDHDAEVLLEFQFNERNEICRIFSQGRYREYKGKYELTPWVGYFSQYEEKHGVRIPTHAEVAWKFPESEFFYFKCRITKIEYEFTNDPIHIPAQD